MALITQTAALLDRVESALDSLTSPAQRALLSADELTTALHQLLVTVEAAAKLAEVARVEALTAENGTTAESSGGGGAALAQRIKTETARIKAEMERVA